MYTPKISIKFEKDLKRAKKRNKDTSRLRELMLYLASGNILPPKYKDHKLIGNYTGHKECHIEPDWLLIYKIDELNKTITFVRTGTHSDLFNK